MGNIFDELKEFKHLQKQLDAYVTREEKKHYEIIDGQARQELLQKVNDTPDIDSIAERNYENRQT